MTIKEEQRLFREVADTLKVEGIPIIEYIANSKTVVWITIEMNTGTAAVQTEEPEMAKTKLLCWPVIEKHYKSDTPKQRAHAYQIFRNGVLEFEIPALTNV
jgi:hypothetical protein